MCICVYMCIIIITIAINIIITTSISSIIRPTIITNTIPSLVIIANVHVAVAVTNKNGPALLLWLQKNGMQVCRYYVG